MGYLGHVKDHQDLHMDLSKVEAIVKYSLLQSRSELRTFFGMCSYHRKFVLGFSKVAAPLQELTSEKVIFKWRVERKVCFDKSKKKSEPKLLCSLNRTLKEKETGENRSRSIQASATKAQGQFSL